MTDELRVWGVKWGGYGWCEGGTTTGIATVVAGGDTQGWPSDWSMAPYGVSASRGPSALLVVGGGVCRRGSSSSSAQGL